MSVPLTFHLVAVPSVMSQSVTFLEPCRDFMPFTRQNPLGFVQKTFLIRPASHHLAYHNARSQPNTRGMVQLRSATAIRALTLPQEPDQTASDDMSEDRKAVLSTEGNAARLNHGDTDEVRCFPARNSSRVGY